jgi:hypothetical protein
MVHKESRHGKGAFPHADHVGLKVGDTKKTGRFGVANVKLESPVAARYGGSMYRNHIDAEWFVTGYGTRALRVATELLANWTAMDTVATDGFFTSEHTGDEGYYGPASLTEASRVIERVFTTLHRSTVFQNVFQINESGFRSSATADWQFGGF